MKRITNNSTHAQLQEEPAIIQRNPTLNPQDVQAFEAIKEAIEAEDLVRDDDELKEATEAEDPVRDDDELKEEKMERLKYNLHKILEMDKVFLQPDIHIEDVAKMLCTNRTYVSRMMREEYGISFIEYVNIARIQYSQQLLYSTNDITLDMVAEKSGFQSTSNYCRTFKRYIGSTPLNWLQGVKK